MPFSVRFNALHHPRVNYQKSDDFCQSFMTSNPAKEAGTGQACQQSRGAIMPYVTTDDGVKLYYEEAGIGFPIVFVHEFAGDHRSYEPQLRYFSRRYRCIAYNARGYPPSDVPGDEQAYSQERARDDICSVLDTLRIQQAHVVGISMGAFATLHFGMACSERARSLVLGGCGYGAEPGKRKQFQAEAEAAAARFETLGIAAAASSYALGATRVQLQNKDPRGWEEFRRTLTEHSARGSALTLRGVQKRRPSLFELVDKMRQIRVPTLIVAGDEDDPCIEASILMKRTIPSAAMVMLPRSGHAINVEEPALFNYFIEQFLHQVESGRWQVRDPRSITNRIL
jgi:pimeloyl-ACP methyl ester carboxylesterase